MTSAVRQILYLVLSALGVVLTWGNNIAWMTADDGGDKSFAGFWTEAFATHVSSSLTLDVIVVAAAGLVFVFAETRRLGMSRWWPLLYFVVSSGVAVAFMLPLFFFFRERHMARTTTDAAESR